MPAHDCRRWLGSILLALTLASLGAPAGRAQEDRFSAPDQAYQNKDYAKAHRLWLALAEEGTPGAYFNLGRLYLFGEGVAIDLLEAYKWFKLAERGGVPQAKAGLNRLAPLMTASDVTEAERRIERWYDMHPRTRR